MTKPKESAAPTRAPATPAPITRTVSCHDAAAEAATGSVTHIDQAGQGVGGVNRTCSRLAVSRLRTPHGRRHIFRHRATGHGQLRPQILEQQLLLAGKSQLEPAEDVIHDRLGEADVGIAGPAAGLEAGVQIFRRTISAERHAAARWRPPVQSCPSIR